MADQSNFSQQDNGIVRNRQDVSTCDKYENMKVLDLRNNMIKTLREMKLPKLESLYLSGKSIFIH